MSERIPALAVPKFPTSLPVTLEADYQATDLRAIITYEMPAIKAYLAVAESLVASNIFARVAVIRQADGRYVLATQNQIEAAAKIRSQPGWRPAKKGQPRTLADMVRWGWIARDKRDASAVVAFADPSRMPDRIADCRRRLAWIEARDHQQIATDHAEAMGRKYRGEARGKAKQQARNARYVIEVLERRRDAGEIPADYASEQIDLAQSSLADARLAIESVR